MSDLAIRQQVRRTILTMALKRQSRGSGSSESFLRERTSRVQFPDIRNILPNTFWAVVGATAVRLYMPERMTNDINILISTHDSAKVREALNLADITRMLGQATEEQLNSVHNLFCQWQLQDLEDLESFILLEKLELQA